MADLHSNNSFDSGASLIASYGSDAFNMDQVSAFTAINSHASGDSVRTVSPQDLHLDFTGSAPPSTAFTNLTSPDASPYTYDSSFDCSPAFQDNLPLLDDPSKWGSLFAGEEFQTTETDYATTAISLPMERTISSQSMERSGSSSTGSPIVLDSSFRRKSSVTNSPATNGISKSRRRKGPLPAITVDPNDKVAMKRARNTLAARESRQRKVDHVSVLEKQNNDLKEELEKWKAIAISCGYTGTEP